MQDKGADMDGEPHMGADSVCLLDKLACDLGNCGTRRSAGFSGI